MKWVEHAALNDQDMEFLAGTPTMEALMRNRLVVVYDKDKKPHSMIDMGLDQLTEPYYTRKINDRDDTIEIMFVSKEDLTNVKQHLTLLKIGGD